MSGRRQIILRWIDSLRKQRQEYFYPIQQFEPSTSTEAGLIAALQDASHAHLLVVSESRAALTDGEGTSGVYARCSNAAAFRWKTTAGTYVDLVVPSPIEDLFLPGTTKVDRGSPLVAAILAEAQDALADANGNELETLVYARRELTRR